MRQNKNSLFYILKYYVILRQTNNTILNTKYIRLFVEKFHHYYILDFGHNLNTGRKNFFLKYA